MPVKICGIGLLCLLLSLSGRQAQAQYTEFIHKGSRLYGISGFARWQNVGLDSVSLNTRNYNISLRSGFFLSKYYVLGVDADYDYRMDIHNDDRSESSIFSMGVFSRYYMPFLEGYLAFFPDVSAKYSWIVAGEGMPMNGVGLNAGGGITWFISSTVATEILLQYNHFALGERMHVSGTALKLGLQVYL